MPVFLLTAWMTSSPEWPSSREVQTPCASEMAASSLGGWMPCFAIWARKAVSVALAAEAVPADNSATRAIAPAAKVVPTNDLVKRVDICYSLVDVGWVALWAKPESPQALGGSSPKNLAVPPRRTWRFLPELLAASRHRQLKRRGI